ncbi:MAG: hypothetical protein IJU68_03330 [Bacteroidales bacterium]|nr:hypothetical protein [Bacteroidales bacterium]MBQ9462671.1 hypothetical protein [Bacteroidales bacterium]
MEQNKEMTAQQSLNLISETMNNSRKEIVRNSGKYFVLWGVLLTVFSLLVYFLWKTTDKVAWNNLWFALPLIGYPLSRWAKNKEKDSRAENFISRINGGIWGTFGVFACSVALFSLLYSQFFDSPLTTIVLGVTLSPQIVLLFGMAETISGITLKNWTIKIAGWITGIGGLAIFYIAQVGAEQMLIFTFAGIVLTATGLIVKHQYK